MDQYTALDLVSAVNRLTGAIESYGPVIELLVAKIDELTDTVLKAYLDKKGGVQ